MAELADFDPETGHLHRCSRTYDGYTCSGNGEKLGADFRDCASLLYIIAQDTEARSVALIEETATALYAKQRAAPHNARISDDDLAGIVNTVVADTALILDGPLTPKDFTP